MVSIRDLLDIYIILMIALMFLSGYFAEYYYNEYIKSKQQTNINSGSSSGKESDDVDPEAVKTIIKGFLIFVAILEIIIDLFGLFGAYKEHLCLTLTFTILMSISAFFSIVSFLITFNNFLSAIVNLAITILAFVFARDLHRSRAQMGAYPMITVQTTQPVPQTVIPVYPTAAVGQTMYPQQQQQQNNAGMGVYGGPPQPQKPPNYSNIPPYMQSSLQNDYPTK